MRIKTKGKLIFNDAAMNKILLFILFNFIFSQSYDPMTGEIIITDTTKIIYDPITGKKVNQSIYNNFNSKKSSQLNLSDNYIKNLAYKHAVADADAKIGYYFVGTSAIGLGSLFGSFLIEQPLFIVTTLIPLIAAADKGDYFLPSSRILEYESNFGKNKFKLYQLTYENKRGQIQSARHFFSSLLGPPITFLGSILALGAILN